MRAKLWALLPWIVLAACLGQAPAANAASGVGVDAHGEGAVIDPVYSTTLTVNGRGFQSIKGGHGGIYVWFGVVKPGWRPSAGGTSGSDYIYVPDSETKSNAGFQRFVAFPGSDTASAAADVMSPDGSWSVTLTVPGSTFQGVGRDGSVQQVDCRTSTCGVITVGAHGVPNANNETFTPVRVAAGTSTQSGSPESTTGNGHTADQDTAATGQSDDTARSAADQDAESSGRVPKFAQPGAQRPNARTGMNAVGASVLSVDRRSATAGRILSWSARNLVPGRQFAIVLDDGLAGSGPHVAGADGYASGVIRLPSDLRAGTHELRVTGGGREASVRFGAVGASDAPTVASAGGEADELGRWSIAFVAASAFAFVLALLVAMRRHLGARDA